MIGYTTLGTNDFDKAVAYYDELLKGLNGSQMMNDGRICIWTNGNLEGMVAVVKPYDEKEATVGNGTMVALNAGTKEKVNEIYAKAIELGSADEGEPGPRGDGGMFYGGYFRDLDGNKLVAYCFGG